MSGGDKRYGEKLHRRRGTEHDGVRQKLKEEKKTREKYSRSRAEQAQVSGSKRISRDRPGSKEEGGE